jgi:hypothetical protein
MSLMEKINKFRAAHKIKCAIMEGATKAVAGYVIGDAVLDAFTGPQIVYAADAKVSAEVLATNDGVLTDVKAAANVGDKDQFQNIGFFVRGRAFVDYNNELTDFSTGKLSIGGTYGIKLFSQVKFTGGRSNLQLGVETFQNVEGLNIHGSVASTIPLRSEEKPLGEILLNLGYNLPGFREQDSIALENQNFTWFNDQMVKGTNRTHVGYRVGLDDGFSLVMGPALEVVYGSKINTTVRGGGFLRLEYN